MLLAADEVPRGALCVSCSVFRPPDASRRVARGGRAVAHDGRRRLAPRARRRRLGRGARRGERGRGVFLTAPIANGTFVGEYGGGLAETIDYADCSRATPTLSPSTA